MLACSEHIVLTVNIDLQHGIPVANAVANVAFNHDDKVVSFGSSFVTPCKLPPAHNVTAHPYMICSLCRFSFPQRYARGCHCQG